MNVDWDFFLGWRWNRVFLFSAVLLDTVLDPRGFSAVCNQQVNFIVMCLSLFRSI